MTAHRAVAALATSLSLAVSPVSAQIEGALPLPVDRSLILPAGEAGATTSFYFSGIPGELRTIEARPAGAVEMEIYDAEGNRLIKRSGGTNGGGETFEFVPPYAETYLLVVTRPGPPVSVTMKSTLVPPTLQQALMATGVGYEFTSKYGTSWSCWSGPGTEVAQFGTLRDGTDFTHRLRIRPDRSTQDTTTVVGTITSVSSVSNWIEGDARFTAVTSNGKVNVIKNPVDPKAFMWPADYERKWRAYTCPD